MKWVFRMMLLALVATIARHMHTEVKRLGYAPHEEAWLR